MGRAEAVIIINYNNQTSISIKLAIFYQGLRIDELTSVN